MPRAIQTFACDWRCGRVNVRRAKIVKHEATCARNPARRACKTCIHNMKDPEFVGCWLDTLAPAGAPARIPDGKAMAFNCQDWEAPIRLPENKE